MYRCKALLNGLVAGSYTKVKSLAQPPERKPVELLVPKFEFTAPQLKQRMSQAQSNTVPPKHKTADPRHIATMKLNAVR